MKNAPKVSTADKAGLMLSPTDLVNEYLRILMIPDPAGVKHFVSPDLPIRFTGNRAMRSPADCSAFNASRYRWVKKKIEKTEVVLNGSDAVTVVDSVGTLYGEWPDGTSFEGNRYVDRYVVSHGLITEMDVWNDSAEWLMVRAGLVKL